MPNIFLIPTLSNLLFISIIASVSGDPTCSLNGDTYTCIAGTENYLLRKDLIQESSSIKKIILRDCKIYDANKDVFKGVPMLEHLDLSLNDMYLPLGLFDNTPNLKELNLTRSEWYLSSLASIPLEDSKKFTGSIGLLFLKEPTRIIERAIHPQLLRHCPKLEVVVFTGYDMSEVAHNTLQACRALKFLDLHRCSLNEVPMFATQPNLKTMNHLKLSSNAITTLDNPRIFDNLENLGILDLSYNFIELIKEEVFKPLKKLKVIHLQNNKIKRIPNTLFQGMSGLGNINLAHNLIEYVPVNAFRDTKLKNLNLADNKFTYLEANFCLELRNSGVTLSKFYFNQNPWQCACLNEILIEANKMNINYNKAKYNGEVPVCVTREFNCKRQTSFNEEFNDMYKTAIRRYTSGKFI